jgi:hypothetical protein
MAPANALGDLRALEWVLEVKVDHVRRVIEVAPIEIRAEIKPEHYLPKFEALKELEKIPDEVEPHISEVETEIIRVSEEIKERERGFGHMIKWFLGLAADVEKQDAKFLREKVQELLDVATKLRVLSETVTNIDAKAVLLEQAELLEAQAEQLQEKSAQKERNAGGLLALIANLFG